MSNPEEKDTSKGSISAAFVGAGFFAVTYLFLNINVLFSLIIGVVGFLGATMIFGGSTPEGPSEIQKVAAAFEATEKDAVKTALVTAKKQNDQIYAMIDKVESEVLKTNLREIYKTATKIINAIEKNPVKYDKAETFFSYYLPATLKILERYDEIENQGIDSADSKKFMASAENMVIKINKSFKNQLNSLYQADIIDTDAEMKVFEKMLGSDSSESHFNI